MTLTQARTIEACRSRRAGLWASIILNLFCVAMIGGHLLRPAFMARQTEGPMSRAVALVESELDAADAAAFETVVQRDRARNAEAERALIAARDALEAELATEPFDPARAKVAGANAREALDRVIDSFSATVVDALDRLSPAGRKTLVEFRRERLAAFDHPKSP